MWFLIVYLCANTMVSEKANVTQLHNKYNFGNYSGDIAQFISRAGIGDYVQINNCVIVRTR